MVYGNGKGCHIHGKEGGLWLVGPEAQEVRVRPKSPPGAEGCLSYDVMLIGESKCLLILPLTAWLICLIMIALTSCSLTNASPASPIN